MVALNRLTGHSPGFFSVYTLPPNQAVSIESQIKINIKRNQTAVEKDIASLIYRKSKYLLKDFVSINNAQNNLFIAEAHDLDRLEDNSIDLVVTSPPFLNIVNYKQDNWMRNWFAGINENISFTLNATDQHAVTIGTKVRRLTAVECERLQGFPDGWTDVGNPPISKRYNALGRSMAVPVMRWIGKQIASELA